MEKDIFGFDFSLERETSQVSFFSQKNKNIGEIFGQKSFETSWGFINSLD